MQTSGGKKRGWQLESAGVASGSLVEEYRARIGMQQSELEKEARRHWTCSAREREGQLHVECGYQKERAAVGEHELFLSNFFHHIAADRVMKLSSR